MKADFSCAAGRESVTVLIWLAVCVRGGRGLFCSHRQWGGSGSSSSSDGSQPHPGVFSHPCGDPNLHDRLRPHHRCCGKKQTNKQTCSLFSSSKTKAIELLLQTKCSVRFQNCSSSWDKSLNLFLLLFYLFLNKNFFFSFKHKAFCHSWKNRI